MLIRGTLGDIRDRVKAAGITRTALILVGRALAGELAPRAGSTPPATTMCCGPRQRREACWTQQLDQRLRAAVLGPAERRRGR